MAITVGCDRCKKVIGKTEGDAFKRGHVIERDYCEQCVVRIDEMVAEIDKLHDRLSAQWYKDLEKIRDDYCVEGGLLPDVSL